MGRHIVEPEEWRRPEARLHAVGAFDAYVGKRVAPQEKLQIFGNGGELFLTDDALGVRPKPGLSTTAKGFIRGEQIYDVVYSFDDAGLRISPPDATGTAT